MRCWPPRSGPSALNQLSTAVLLLTLTLLLRESGAEKSSADEVVAEKSSANEAAASAPTRVAILGAGIGGTSAAYFLRQKLPNAEIDILEMDKVVGGRLATLQADGREYEIGGAIIHPANRVMRQLSELCGLEPRTDPSSDSFALLSSSSDNNNSHQLVYQSPSWGGPLAVSLSLLHRYGPLTLYRLKHFIDNLLESFGQIYPRLAAGVGYPTLVQLLTAMSPTPAAERAAAVAAIPPEMVQLTEVDLAAKLRSLGLDELLIGELVMVASKVNYGQLPGQLHALVGAVSLAGTQGDLWRIKGGNRRVPACLVEQAKANLLLNTKATEVQLLNNTNSSYRIAFEQENSNATTRDYDIVVIARPLTVDQSPPLKLTHLPPPLPAFPGRYHHTYTYLIHGQLNASRLGLSDSDELANNHFFITPSERIASLSRLTPVDDDEVDEEGDGGVYKMFARESLTAAEIGEYFTAVHSLQTVDWLAYPHYPSNKELGSFELHPGLYHVNAVEWAASAMEMSALAGWNVANLAADYGTSSSRKRRRGSGAESNSKRPRVEL